ncbi:hypothetical protein F511_17695 [Dorcoceras hygrometricum]|uniref:Uncharacterized protein n=1 Tax=Dorcoceras hygrometricum TaxID=472368 RepID=A0A2Z6ZYR2_9LAMI|nr:hypothetical protein F511_17695 [Dorcoceras hygrometricum]
MGPISHTGPKTSRPARDRPEPKPRRNQTSRHDIAGAAAGDGATTTKNARSAKRRLSRNIARASRGQRAPSRNQRPSCAAASINASASLHRDTSPSEFQQRPANIGATARPARSCDARQARIACAIQRQRSEARNHSQSSAGHVRQSHVKKRPWIGSHVQQITPIRSTTGYETPSSPCTRRRDEICTDGFSSSNWLEKIFRRRRGGGGGALGRRRRSGFNEERRGGACFRVRDTASRGPTIIAAPESQFRTCPSDHGKASSNIAP